MLRNLLALVFNGLEASAHSVSLFMRIHSLRAADVTLSDLLACAVFPKGANHPAEATL